MQEVKKSDGGARYCKKCNQYKPPRSHHCRVCERCVLRMVSACRVLMLLVLANSMASVVLPLADTYEFASLSITTAPGSN